MSQYNEKKKKVVGEYEKSMRDVFLFGDVIETLRNLNSLEVLKVYDVRHARVPIVKLKYKDALNLDVSLGIVNNAFLHGFPVSQLKPADSETQSVL